MARPTHRRVVGVLVLGGLALAACVPATPPPTEPASAPGCGSNAAPTPADPVAYVAVVDDPGASAPDVETFTATSEAERDAHIDALEAEGDVVAVEPEQVVQAMAITPDPRSPEQWGLTNSGFSGAWSAGFDGSDVRIAIIDSGVRASHEDLTGRVVQGVDFFAGSESAPAGDSDYGRLDFYGHGTHVAGIAAASDNGAGGLGGAPGATIVPVRVLGPNGSGSSTDLVAAILWAADPTKGNAHVLNMSLGGGTCSSTEQAAVDYAESQGAVVVAAAGNSGVNVPIYPAGFDGEVIAAGATTSANAKASFSNWGTPYVDLGAPGSNVLSTYPFDESVPRPFPASDSAYKNMSGTSMATPYIAAVAALVLQHCPAIVNGAPDGASRGDKVLALLQSTASPSISGLGASLVQAAAATASACPT